MFTVCFNFRLLISGFTNGIMLKALSEWWSDIFYVAWNRIAKGQEFILFLICYQFEPDILTNNIKTLIFIHSNLLIIIGVVTYQNDTI